MVRTRATPKSPALKKESSPQGKIALLDAAESLFSRQGYFGTSIREITKLADVPLSLANYHFPSKEDLYKQVLRRRLPRLLAMIEEELDRALQHPSTGAEKASQIVGSYITANLNFAATDEAHVCYLRLLQHTIAIEKFRHVTQELASNYGPIYDRFIAGLRQALPMADPELLELRFHLARLMLAGAIIDLKLPHPLSLRETEPLQSLAHSFCAHGFNFAEP